MIVYQAALMDKGVTAQAQSGDVDGQKTVARERQSRQRSAGPAIWSIGVGPR